MVAFVSAKPEFLDRLLHATSECPPVLFEDDLVSELAKQLGETDSTRTVVSSIIRTLIAVYTVLRIRAGLNSLDAAIEAVTTIKADAKFGTPSDGWDAFQRRLERFLSDETALGLSARAISISTETRGHMHVARVLTDARPVFGENAKDGPKAFVIIHTLQIEHYENGENREWFVSLDGDDLENLQGVVERALAKEGSLRSMVEKLGVPVLTWKVE